MRTLTAVLTAAVLAVPTALSAGAATPVAQGRPAPAAASVPAALPAVDMEAVVKAAQIDPRRPDDTRTAGARAGVLLVERALAARGLLAARWVDGYFGTTTIAAYAAYQRSLGYRGLAATGLPGIASLTALGARRYAVTRPLRPGGRVHWAGSGPVVDTRTRAMLAAAEQLAGRSLVLSQGSCNPGGDPTSAGTHDGGGVVDVSVSGMSAATRTAVVTALRRVGFAAWLRNPRQGDWPWHIHAVAISDTDLSAAAQHQVGDYYLGLDGLADHAADDGPRIPIRTWEEYRRR
ncbi:peptidoglycan-binding domain-containing protein [Nakamurella endophytica]|uniref:peptidoglycan-binding domain-containing protein n=1 Tax=Nakamurella endophytica TaxID=1748367 RepID=UPI0035717105